MRMHRTVLALAPTVLLLGACSGGSGASSNAGQTPTAVNERASQRLTAHPLGETDAPAGYYEYLPPGYGDGTARPLLVFLHGFGGNGDGSAAELDNLFDGGIPELIHSNRWPSDRPFVVLAPQHASPPDDAADPAYAQCDAAPHGASCVMRIQHDKGHPVARTYCATPAEVHSFLSYAIARFDVDPRARVPDRAQLWRIRRLRVPGPVRCDSDRGPGCDRRRRASGLGQRGMPARCGTHMGIPRRRR